VPRCGTESDRAAHVVVTGSWRDLLKGAETMIAYFAVAVLVYVLAALANGTMGTIF